MKRCLIISLISLISIISASCVSQSEVATPDINQLATQTAAAMPTSTPSPTIAIPTNTPTVTLTPTDTPTVTPQPPTITFVPTIQMNRPPSITGLVDQTCNVGDVLEREVTYNDPDGDVMSISPYFSNSDTVRADMVNSTLLRIACLSGGTSSITLTVEDERGKVSSTSFIVTVIQPPPQQNVWDCNGNQYDCGDFSSCQQMWDYWRACPGDPSNLDGEDNDGRPCEFRCGS